MALLRRGRLHSLVEEMAQGRSQLRDPSGVYPSLTANEEKIEPDFGLLVGQETGKRAQAETLEYVKHLNM